MNFEINPCKACKEKYKNGDCDINTVNSCVAETAAAFAGIPSNNLIKNTTDANNNWSTCMEDMMAEQGRTPCDFQLSMAPVWVQVPHYFPTLFAETGDPLTAKNQCLLQCRKNMRNMYECIQNCETDFAAVKVINGGIKDKNESKKNESKKNESKKNESMKNESKKNMKNMKNNFPSNSGSDSMDKTVTGMSIFIGVIFVIILILIPIGIYFSYKTSMARYKIAGEAMKQGNTSLAMTAMAPEIGQGISSIFNPNNNNYNNNYNNDGFKFRLGR